MNHEKILNDSEISFLLFLAKLNSKRRCQVLKHTHISYSLFSYVRLTNVPKYQSNYLSFVITKKGSTNR